MSPEQGIVDAAVQGMGLSGLLAARAEARRLVEDDGVHYGVEGDRRWTIDPMPMVIGHEEWADLEAGLQQRALVLNLLLEDIYGQQLLLKDGTIPAEMVLGHAGFLHQAHGIPMPNDAHLTMLATDLGRTQSGAWCVMADRTSAPSGAGYAMVNRRITSRVMADLHRVTRLTRLRGFFTATRQALQQAAPGTDHAPRGVMLWSGSVSETAYEQGFLATLLGLSLVEAEDLTTHEGALWVEDPDGRVRVDLLLRRIDSHYCDPLEWRSDSQLGIAGMLHATRVGNLTVANRLGSGVLENAGLLSVLPRAARAMLGEDLRLPTAQTWWCGTAQGLSHVTRNLDSLVVKPIARGLTSSSVPGWALTDAERDDLTARIRQRPWEWVGQEAVHTSTAPVVTDTGLQERRTVLRTFGVNTRDGWVHMRGGLARVAQDDSTFLVANTAGALAKDVWVLDSDEAVSTQLTRPTRDEIHLWTEGSDPRPLPPRAADNLYWFGRYGERVDSTNRLLVAALDLSEDFGNRPGTPGHRVMQQVFEAIETLTALQTAPDAPSHSSRQLLRRTATDPALVGSLAHDITMLDRAAHEVPDRLSADVWPLLATLNRLMAEANGSPDLDEVRSETMAIAGVTAESMVRDNSWAMVDAGIRVERAVNTLWFLTALFDADLSANVEGHLVEVLAGVCDSGITHQRRQASGVGPSRPLHAAVLLLVLDPTNPRSVAFQLQRLADDLELMGDETCRGQAKAVLASLRMHRGTLLGGERTAVWDVLEEAETAVRRVSQSIAERHFGRSRPRVVTHTRWLTPVTPRLSDTPPMANERTDEEGED